MLADAFSCWKCDQEWRVVCGFWQPAAVPSYQCCVPALTLLEARSTGPYWPTFTPALTSCSFSHLALTGVLNLSTCTQKSLLLVESYSPKMQTERRFWGWKEKRAHGNSFLHSQIDVKPLDGLPWNRWRYNMRTALLTDPSILRLCWESSTSLRRGLPSQNCQMATPPFMWKGSCRKDSIHNDTLGVLPLPSGILSLCVSCLSFDYHGEHDVETSRTIY